MGMILDCLALLIMYLRFGLRAQDNTLCLFGDETNLDQSKMPTDYSPFIWYLLVVAKLVSNPSEYTIPAIVLPLSMLLSFRGSYPVLKFLWCCSKYRFIKICYRAIESLGK